MGRRPDGPRIELAESERGFARGHPPACVPQAVRQLDRRASSWRSPQPGERAKPDARPALVALGSRLPPRPLEPDLPTDAPPPSRRVRIRDLLLPIGLSLGALGLVLWWTWEPGAFDTVRDSFRPGLFSLAVVVLAAYLVTGGLRFRHISNGVLSARDGVRGQLTWDFMSAVTPSAMGGAPFAAFFIARENGLAFGQVTSIMLFSMLLDQLWYATIIVTMYVAAIWLPVFPTGLGAVGIGTVALYLGGLLIYIGVFAYATLVRPDLIERIATWVVRWKPLRRFEDRVRREARRLRHQAKVLRSQPLSFYLKGAAYTFVYWMGRYGLLVIVALSFTRDLRPLLVAFRGAGLFLSGLVMPTPGGSGGIEGLFVLFVSPLLPEGYGGPVLIAWRFLTYYVVLALGLFVAGRAVKALLMGDTPPPDPDLLPPPASS